MCTFNGARYLTDQLESLIAQMRTPDEVVICDDCSTDSTLNLLKQFSASAPFPVNIYENTTRLGSTKNFERAISLCQGELIALCDQDDIWEPAKLSSIEQRFAENANASLVFTDADVVDEHGNSLGYRLWDTLHFDKPLQDHIRSPAAFALLDKREVVTGATMAFRTKFRDLVLPIPDDTVLIHDGWIALMISLAGSFDLVDRPLVKYRQHSGQQIGARHMQPSVQSIGVIEQAKRRNPFAQEIKKLEVVSERIISRKNQYEFKLESDIARRLHHLRRRLAISQRKISGIPAAFTELVTGRYHRFSNGFYSFAKDLLTW